jgi:hypothetical protein
MARTEAHKREFKARFRRHAFGWKSQPAITRVKQAVTEIRKVSRKEPLVAAEGAVTFLERVSPALENVDSSSSAIGTAVTRAIEELVAIIANAPADRSTRSARRSSSLRGGPTKPGSATACARAVEGYGYDITGADAWEAYRSTMAIADVTARRPR